MKTLMKSIFILLVWSFPLYAQDIAITVYNQSRALVRDTRDLSIASGTSMVSFTNVAAQIDPTSVHFKSLSSPGKLNVLEQNFEYDLISADKILEKYIDEDIRLVAGEGQVFRGRLLSAARSDIVLKDQDGGIKIIRGSSVEHFDFPNLPEGLITRPTLKWLLNNRGPQKHKTEISYLTGGVNWHAEYVAVTDKEDKRLDISGWVSVDNRSGAVYKNAKIKLVAGDVHVVQPEVKRRSEKLMAMEGAVTAAPQFEEKAFFEYHLYTLQRKATLKNNQIKQISLFPPASTKVTKLFIYDGARYQDKVRVNLEFENNKAEGLGLPLPKGKIRVYKADEDDALEFIGEDKIDHTPKDEKVRMFLGNAFDLVGERVHQSTKKLSKRSREEIYKIVLKNHKEKPVDIIAVEHFWGDWVIQQNSHPYKKKDANTAEFKVNVPADGEVSIAYTVLLTW